MAVKPKPKKLCKTSINRIAERNHNTPDIDSVFARKIEIVYNRLQDDAHAAFKLLAKHVNVSYNDVKDMAHVAGCLSERCDTTIKTMQLNSAHGLTNYQVTMCYTDMSEKPVYGWYRKAKYAVINSPSMANGVILAYLAVSKQAGRFI